MKDWDAKIEWTKNHYSLPHLRRLGLQSAWCEGFEPWRDAQPPAKVYGPFGIGYLNGTFYVDGPALG